MFVVLLSLPALLVPSGAVPRAPTPSCCASRYDVDRLKGERPLLKEAAGFFVEAFWSQGTTTDEVQLSDSERRELTEHQADDMQSRYAELVGARRLPSQMFAARDPVSGAMAGCVGVEAALVDPLEGKVLSRARSEALFSEEFNSMGARERNQYRKMPLAELTAVLLPEYKPFALLANLAVDRATRRSGLARELCAQCEGAGASWGLPAILLQVEEGNEAARGLYTSVGYREVFRSQTTALRVQPGGGGGDKLLAPVPSTLIAMAKAL